uniref:Replication restart DNA helicase PriA n=1 Tax=Desertifilum tharense IPPAS B-1220 TaxID=1781255 RepID=A0ACD5GN73_9CYAN
MKANSFFTNLRIGTLESKIEINNLKMQLSQVVCCPNCGSQAERNYIADSDQTQTQCLSCDYLLVTCAQSGKVVEAYSPGVFCHR